MLKLHFSFTHHLKPDFWHKNLKVLIFRVEASLFFFIFEDEARLCFPTYQSKKKISTYRLGQIFFFSQKQRHTIFSKSSSPPPPKQWNGRSLMFSVNSRPVDATTSCRPTSRGLSRNFPEHIFLGSAGSCDHFTSVICSLVQSASPHSQRGCNIIAPCTMNVKESRKLFDYCWIYCHPQRTYGVGLLNFPVTSKPVRASDTQSQWSRQLRSDGGKHRCWLIAVPSSVTAAPLPPPKKKYGVHSMCLSFTYEQWYRGAGGVAELTYGRLTLPTFAFGRGLCRPKWQFGKGAL